jgi:hypothetical protein
MHPMTSWDNRSLLTPPEFDEERFREEEAMEEAEADFELNRRYENAAKNQDR